jgi:hypothetical protein
MAKQRGTGHAPSDLVVMTHATLAPIAPPDR